MAERLKTTYPPKLTWTKRLLLATAVASAVLAPPTPRCPAEEPERPGYAELAASVEAQSRLISELLSENQDRDATHSHCCNCSCDPCCCPGWTVTADALFLARSRGDSLGLVLESNLVQTTLPGGDVSDLDFGVAVGPRISLTRRLRSWGEIEIGYFGIDEWSARSVIVGAAPGPALRRPFFVTLDLGGSEVTIENSSRLYSGELNFRAPRYGSVTWLAGFRAMELDERYTASVSPPAGTGLADIITTRNQMYGFQIGGLYTPVERNRIRLELMTKAGAFHNNIHSDYHVTSPISNTINSEHDLAFFGEMSLTGSYQLTDRWAVRVGFQLMLLDSVALAPAQVAVIANNSVDKSGSVLYYGGLAGLECAW